MSLRLRLALMVLLIFLFSTAAFIAGSALEARQNVRREVRSSANLVSQLLALHQLQEPAALAPERLPSLMPRLEALSTVRHVDLSIVSNVGDYSDINQRLGAQAPDVPAWFVALVRPPSRQAIGVFPLNDRETLVFHTSASDALEQAWVRARKDVLLRLAALLAFGGALFWLLGRWLRPVDAFVRALDDIERGDYSRRVPRMPLPELTRLAERMNRLTASLGASNADNVRLARKSLRIQEQERRHLAQELHDAMGQSISAIKAIAVSIRQRSEQADPVIAGSAGQIEEISDRAYSSVRGMMGRLRPAMLDELGLAAALEQMVDDWNQYHEDAFCRLRIETDLNGLQDEQRIHVYRIVQEALTNIARHARAQHVTIVLSGKEVISLSIDDDGIGYDPRREQRGMGLSGIRDRVRALQGELQINARPRRGVHFQIEFPRQVNAHKRRITDVV